MCTGIGFALNKHNTKVSQHNYQLGRNKKKSAIKQYALTTKILFAMQLQIYVEVTLHPQSPLYSVNPNSVG